MLSFYHPLGTPLHIQNASYLGIVEYLVDPAVEVEHGGVGRRRGGEAVDVGEGERGEGALLQDHNHLDHTG